MLQLLGYILIASCLGLLGYFGGQLFLKRYSSYEQLALRNITEELDQVYLFMDPTKFFHLAMLVSACMFLFGFALGGGGLGGITLGGGLAVVGFWVPRIVIRSRIKERMENLEEQLPETLDMLSSSLRAGLTLEQAIGRAQQRLRSPVTQEFGVILHECRLGSSVADAINHWADRTGLMDIKIVAAATEVAVRLGGNLAETYDNLSQLVRGRLMFEREMGALTAEGRMQGIVMALLPLIILILMSLINREMMIPFLLSKLGFGLILLVGLMQIAAYFWIKKITDVEY